MLTQIPASGALSTLALAVTLLSATAFAQEPEPAPATAEPPEIQAIPLEEVSARAEATALDLASMPPTDGSRESLQEIAGGLKALRSEIAERVASTTANLATSTTVRRLQNLENQLKSLLTQFTVANPELESELGRVSDVLAGLEQTALVWDATRDSARQAGASSQTVRRIEATQREISKMRTELVAWRNEILNVRDQMVDPKASIDRTLETIDAAKKLRMEGVLRFDREPLWSDEFWDDVELELQGDWTAPIRERASEVAAYARDGFRIIVFQILLFAALVVGLRELRVRAKARAEETYDLREAEKVFEQPALMAFLLALSLSNLLHPLAPDSFIFLAITFVILPAVLIARRLAPPTMAPIVWALPILFLVDQVRDVIDTSPTVENLLLMGELLGAAGFVLWLLQPRRMAKLSPEDLRTHSFRLIGAALRIVVALFALAVVTDAVGLTSLAELLGSGVLGGAYRALFIYVLVKVFQSLLAYALVLQPLRLLKMVSRHRQLVRRRLERAIQLIAVLIWIYTTLAGFGLATLLRSTIERILTAGVAVGTLSITVADVATFGLTLWISLLLARFVDFVLQEDVFTRVRLARGVPYAVSSMVRYTLLFLGFLFALAAAGIQLSQMTVIVGGLGVGIGFGLQNIVNNFVSGMVLLFERPLQVGDTVQLKVQDLWGTIRRIGIRASVIQTFDGAEVIVPNGQLISDAVTNWTFSDRRRRIDVKVGVEYGTDAQRVIDLLLEVARSNERVLESPNPRAFFMEFGDSSLDFLLRVWVADFDEGYSTRSELSVAVQRALAEANIGVPFPQRDLHLRSVSSSVATQIRGPASGTDSSSE